LQFDTHLERRTKFKQDLASRRIVLTTISDPKHIYYFTGFQTANPRPATLLFLPLYGDPVLMVGSTEAKRAQDAFKGRLVTFKDYDVDKRMVVYPEFMAEQLREMATLWPDLHGRVGIESWHLPAMLYDAIKDAFGATMVNVSGDILSMRFEVPERDRKDQGWV